MRSGSPEYKIFTHLKIFLHNFSTNSTTLITPFRWTYLSPDCCRHQGIQEIQTSISYVFIGAGSSNFDCKKLACHLLLKLRGTWKLTCGWWKLMGSCQRACSQNGPRKMWWRNLAAGRMVLAEAVMRALLMSPCYNTLPHITGTLQNGGNVVVRQQNLHTKCPLKSTTLRQIIRVICYTLMRVII